MAIGVVVRDRAVELVAGGESCQEAARRVGVSGPSVWRWVTVAGMVVQRGRIGGVWEASERRRSPRSRPRPTPGPVEDYLDGRGRLASAGRVLIGIRIRERRTHSAIAAELGVHRSTVAREVAAGSVEGHYRAGWAQRRAEVARRRPKVRKLRPGTVLWDRVKTGLDAKQSPEQIAGRLKLDFAGRDDMQVSHETIYQALYVQGAGGLRHELTVDKALRQGRTSRRPRSKLPPRPGRSWIGTATITARPAEADDRAVPGHWEGDLVIGSGEPGAQSSALITLVERATRFTLISRIDTHDTATVTDRLTQMATGLPATLWRSLTWDQGVEMSGHARFTVETGCPVFFCDPHSPWQRPTNENHNGLIRDFYPKGTNFARVTDTDIAHTELLLNTRPRKILGYATPAETLDRLLNVAPTP